MFRNAVRTIEGYEAPSFGLRASGIEVLFRVKADSLFSYQPPINVLALCIMLPASYILTPRWFHKVGFLNATTPTQSSFFASGQCFCYQDHEPTYPVDDLIVRAASKKDRKYELLWYTYKCSGEIV